jgi:hypothetical protein
MRANGDPHMQAWLQNSLLACSVAVAAGFVALPSARAVEWVELRWEQLIPESLRQVATPDLRAKISPRSPMTQRSAREDFGPRRAFRRRRATAQAVPAYSLCRIVRFVSSPAQPGDSHQPREGNSTDKLLRPGDRNGCHQRNADGNDNRQDRLPAIGRCHRSTGAIARAAAHRAPKSKPAGSVPLSASQCGQCWQCGVT